MAMLVRLFTFLARLFPISLRISANSPISSGPTKFLLLNGHGVQNISAAQNQDHWRDIFEPCYVAHQVLQQEATSVNFSMVSSLVVIQVGSFSKLVLTQFTFEEIFSTFLPHIKSCTDWSFLILQTLLFWQSIGCCCFNLSITCLPPWTIPLCKLQSTLALFQR